MRSVVKDKFATATLLLLLLGDRKGAMNEEKKKMLKNKQHQKS
jgi:hypothetical protein